MNPDVFYKAAKRVAEQDFLAGIEHRCCCEAIRNEGGTSSEFTFFSYLFRKMSIYWFGSPRNEENRGPRVIALLLAAEIAKDME